MKRKGHIVETGLVLALAGLVLAGCATSTVASRKQERAASYAGLTPEARAAVDKGQLEAGLSMDAVYIAWGKPSQILNGQTPTGLTVTWIYYGIALQEDRYWDYRYYPFGYTWYPGPFLDYGYYPRRYVRGEVIFQGGVVKSWRKSVEPSH